MTTKSNESDIDMDDDVVSVEDVSEKIAKALDGAEFEKISGNSLLKEGNYADALKRYDKGLELLEDYKDRNQGCTDVYVALRLNSAAATLKLDDVSKCREHCNKVLLIDTKNVKALYRRAVAQRMLQEYDDALEGINFLISIDPQNREARTELNLIKEGRKDYRRLQKESYQKLFADGPGLYADQEKLFEKLKEEYNVYVETRQAANEVAATDADMEEEKIMSFSEWRDKERGSNTASQKKTEDAISNLAPIIGASGTTLCDSDTLDDEEQKLLSEIKGKGYYHGRLNTVPSAAAPTPQAMPTVSPNQESTGMSSWNSAGTTWEEKDKTEAAKNLFKEVMRKTKLPVSEAEDRGSISLSADVKECHASIAASLGKRRYMFDINASIKCKHSVGEKSEELAKLRTELTDATTEEELTFAIKDEVLKKVANDALRAGFRRFVQEYQAIV